MAQQPLRIPKIRVQDGIDSLSPDVVTPYTPIDRWDGSPATQNGGHLGSGGNGVSKTAPAPSAMTTRPQSSESEGTYSFYISRKVAQDCALHASNTWSR